MLLLFPTLAAHLRRESVSAREAARRLGVSSPHAGELLDFATVPAPENFLLIERARELLPPAVAEKIRPEHDYLLDRLRPVLEPLLIRQPAATAPTPRGPLLEAIRLVYFSEAGDMVLFRLPQDPHVQAVLDTACFRFFSPDTFRRRARPRRWRFEPPLYSRKNGDTVIFAGKVADSRNIFHFHPHAHLFAYLLFCALLQGFSFSFSSGDLEACEGREDVRYMRHYAEFPARALRPGVRFTLLPPGRVEGVEGEIGTEGRSLHVCLKDLRSPLWCWCLRKK